MTTRYVPVVVVMPKEDHDRLVAAFEPIEYPADIRQIMATNGWTQESLMLGHILSIAATNIDAPST